MILVGRSRRRPRETHTRPTTAESFAREAPPTARIDWSPYLVGAGIGPLSWIAFAVFGDPLGVTTAYSRVASLFAVPVIGPEAVAQNSCWKSMPLKWDYGVWSLVGIRRPQALRTRRHPECS